jgi:hypothetical protein
VRVTDLFMKSPEFVLSCFKRPAQGAFEAGEGRWRRSESRFIYKILS